MHGAAQRCNPMPPTMVSTSTSRISLLQQLEDSGVNVDVDSFVPEIAQSLPFTPHDATSNQALIGLCVLDPKQYHVVEDTVKSMPGSSPLHILTVLVSQSPILSKRQLEAPAHACRSMPSSAGSNSTTSPAGFLCSHHRAFRTMKKRS